MLIRTYLTHLATSVPLAVALACTGSFQNNSEQIVAQNSSPNLAYGDLVIQEGSEYIMIPVGSSQKQGQRGYFSSYDSKGLTYTNMIFYNPKNGETHFLLNRKALISSFEFIEAAKEKDKPVERFILFRIVERDTSGDEKLDYEDAGVGYISDLSGKNLRQITPLGTQMTTWKFDKKRGMIFLQIIKDSDGNKKFTEPDETNFVRVEIKKPGVGKEIISNKIQQYVKSLNSSTQN